MWGIIPKLSVIKLSVFGCTVFMRKRDRDVSKIEPKALEGKFVGYTEGDNGYQVYVGLNPWQHRDARHTRWGVTATEDLAPILWSSRRWQQRRAGHIYCNKGRVAWRREREHSRNNTETRCLGCWGSSTGRRIYCKKRESHRLWVTGRHWNGGLLTDSWLLWRGTGASGQGRAQTRDTSKECCAIFWGSQDPSCCDWG